MLTGYQLALMDVQNRLPCRKIILAVPRAIDKCRVIVGRINAGASVLDNLDANYPTIGKKSKLFQRLSFFQLAALKSRNSQQTGSSKTVKFPDAEGKTQRPGRLVFLMSDQNEIAIRGEFSRPEWGCG